MLGICSIRVKQKSEIISGWAEKSGSCAENAGSSTEPATLQIPPSLDPDRQTQVVGGASSDFSQQDLIARTPEGYADAAVRLARDKPAAGTASRTAGKMSASSLTGAGRLTWELEAAFRGVWKAWCGSAGIR